MRPAIAIVVSLVVVAGCHGSHAAEPASDDDNAAFTDRAGFEPRSFSVEVTGPTGARPIIFIPGLGCPGAVFAPTVAHLGDAYQAHVLTLAGFAGLPPIKQPLSAMVRTQR